MEFNINIPKVEISFDLGLNNFNNRYQKDKQIKNLPKSMVKYSNAIKLAKELKLENNIRYNCIVAGNFIFGDFIEAFIVENNAKCKNLSISTLSLDQNNVDSLRNLIEGGFVDSLSLIVSDYFYSHERSSLIPYIYENLDIDNKFQLSVAGSHTKIAIFETLGGKKVVIHGRANLRSSSNIEQFAIEENKELYDFHLDYHKSIEKEYNTINKERNKHKSLRGGQLWASGSTGGGSGSRLKRSTPAGNRKPKYQSDNPGGANYVPF